MATLEQLKEGIIRAHQAGNLEHAKILADAYKAQAAQETAPVEAPSEELPSRSIGDIGSDIVTGAAKGITSALQAGVGLADIPTGGEAGKALKPYLDLEKLQEEYSKHYSPQQQAAIKATEEAKGFGGTLEAYAQNPSAIVSSVGESIPSMLVGGGLGKGLQTIKALKGLATPVVAGALGEGLVGAGAAAESLREQAPDELLSGKGTVAALGAGIGTALFGLAGGKLAEKFGVVDPDTLMTGGLKALKSESANAGEEIAKKSFLKDMIGAGISEGVFEEMPQSAQEKMWANFAMDRPLTEGVSEAMASGLVTGAAMGTGAGGGFNVFQGPQGVAPPPPPPSTEPPKEEVAPIMAPTVEALTPQAQLIADVNDLKKKTAIVNDWIGTDRGKLFNEIMAQDFGTHEGLDKVEELLGGKESTLNKRGLSMAEKDLEKYRGAIDVTKEIRSSEEQAIPEQATPEQATPEQAVEVHPNITAAQSALDAYTAKPSLPANIRAVNEAASTLGIGGDLANKVSSMQNIVAQAQPVAQPAVDLASENQEIQAIPQSRVDMHFKDVTKRIEGLTTAANQLKNGEITAADYDKLVNELKPVLPYESAPTPTPVKDMQGALTSDKVDKIGVPAKTLKEGDPVGLRLDIPAYRDHGAWVVSVHDARPSTKSGMAGKALGYDNVASVTNAKFGINEKAGLNIAAGKSKATIATVEGQWNPVSEQDAYQKVQAALNDPAWAQVGMDPERHAYFYDRKNMEPVVSADEVVQIGPLVMAKNPVYADKNSFLYAERSDIQALPTESTKVDEDKAAFAEKLGAKYEPGTFQIYDRSGTKVINKWDTGRITEQETTGLEDAINHDVSGAGRTFDRIFSQLSKSNSPFIRQISELAKNHERGKTLWYTTKKRMQKNWAGVYTRPMHAIKLARGHKNSEQTMAHEIIHGLVADAIDNPNQDQKATVAALNKLFRTVKKHPTLQGHYGLTNLQEFVAEAMSNPEFQYALSKIPYENTNMWDKFTKFIADLLGIKHDNALTEAIGHTEALIDLTNDVNQIPIGAHGQREPPKPPKPPKTQLPPSVPMGGPLVPVQKSTWQKTADYIESMLFSSDAALLNGLERSMRNMGMPFAHIKKVMLASSTAQAVHSAYLGMQGARQGQLKYNPLTYAWEATKGVSVNDIKDKVLSLGKQYGVDPKESMDVFQNIMEARRVKEIHESANNVLRNYKAIRLTDIKKAAAYLRANRKILLLSKRMTALQMTEEEANDILDSALEEYPDFFNADGPVAMWREVRDNTVRFMVDSGAYSRNQAEALMEAAAYVPFQRIIEAEDPAKVIKNIYNGTAHSLLGGRKRHGIKGSAREVRNIFLNMEEWQAHSFAIGVKNHKALQLIDSTQMYMPDGSVREVKPGTSGAIMVYRHGKKEYYKYADPLFYHAFNGMQGITTDALRFGSKYASIYQNFIVRNPLFTLAQLPQDTYAAMYTSGLKNPLALPIEVVKQFYKTVRGQDTQERTTLTKRGITGDTGFNTIDVHEMEQILGVIPEETALHKINKWLSHFSEAGDAAVRQAVYARTMKEMRGLPDAEAIATQRAADIINFRRRGASATSNMIRQVVPFYGAYLQAQRVAIRTLSGRGVSPTQRSDALRTLALTTAQTVALGMIYAALIGDDDKFKEMSPQERDSKLLIPGTNFEIPLRRDWTLLPHVIGMHAYSQIFDKGTEDPDTAKRAFKDALLTAAFSIPTPVPFLIKPEVEVAINHNFFTGGEIETQAMERLDVDKKFLPTTSILGKLVGKTGIMSPVSFDHILKGHTGQLGSAILAVTDAALSRGFDIPYTEKTVTEMVRAIPGTVSIYGKEFHNGDASKFYNLLNDVIETSTTMSWKEKNAPDEISKYAEEKGKLLDEGVKSSLSEMRRQLHDITDEERRIGNMPNKVMPPAEKRNAIAELKQAKKNVLSQIQEVRNYVYR